MASMQQMQLGYECEIIHCSEHLTTPRPGDVNLVCGFNLPGHGLPRDAQCQQHPPQSSAERRRKGLVSSRKNHRQQRPFTLAQDVALATDVQQIGVPVAQNSGGCRFRIDRRQPESLQDSLKCTETPTSRVFTTQEDGSKKLAGC